MSVAIDWPSGGSATRFGSRVPAEAVETLAQAPRANRSSAATTAAHTPAITCCETFISLPVLASDHPFRAARASLPSAGSGWYGAEKVFRVWKEVIDLHCHLLPGIDDGPREVDGSLALAERAAAEGIETIVATPHVSSRYRNDATTIAAAAAELEAGGGAPLEVLLGAEVAATRIAELDRDELGGLRLGDGPWMLLEPPFASVLTGLDAAVDELHSLGYRVLLAHPERCEGFRRRPALLEALIDRGALGSVTSGSLVGQFGGEAKRMALQMLDAGLAHNVASDAHDAVNRPPSIAAEIEASGWGELREWLTLQVPAAILAGAEIPRRPPVAARPRRRLLPWRRG